MTPRMEPGRRLAGMVSTWLFIAASIALIAGPAYWINGLTQPLVRIDGALAQGLAVPTGTVPVQPGVIVSAPSGASARLTIFDAGDGAGVHLSTATKLLWRSDRLVLSLAIALGAFLLARLASEISAGRPFAARNPRRIALVAASLAVGGTLPFLLTGAALGHALDDAGLSLGHPLNAPGALDLAPLLGAVAILVLAQAFRDGTQVSEDLKGLV